MFRGETINTPSMLCVEDALDGLEWGEKTGGLDALVARAEANLAAVAGWVGRTDWADFLATDPATRSCTSVCLKVVDPWFDTLSADQQASFTKRMETLLDGEGVAFDINGYRDAPPGLRLWAGATVETADLEALFPWLAWAYAEVKRDLAAVA